VIAKSIKKIARSFQGWLERYLIGGLIQACIWRFRHLYKKNWAKASLESANHSHRGQIVDSIVDVEGVHRILEVGCAAGANLVRLRKALPEVNLLGVDINKKAIQTAREYFLSLEDTKVDLFVKRANQLLDFKENSVDVVFSDAVMMFIPPRQIGEVVSGMVRMSSNTVIFNEYHLDGAVNGFFDGGRWVYDYVALMNKYFPKASVNVSKSDFSGGCWDEYGSLITVKL